MTNFILSLQDNGKRVVCLLGNPYRVRDVTRGAETGLQGNRESELVSRVTGKMELVSRVTAEGEPDFQLLVRVELVSRVTEEWT